MKYAIETNQLSKKYSGRFVVDHVNMHIPEGCIYGFVGENGSGKTTIMRLLMGLARPTTGSYKLFEVPNTDSKIYAVRNKISAIVEAPSLVPTMTAEENLTYAAMYYGAKLSKSNILDIVKQVGLENVGNKVVKNYSLGMKQRLGIAVLLLNEPNLLLLDEPMNGLDPQGIAELRDLILKLNQKGITVVISSHILSELEKVANYWGFISHGQLLEEMSEHELLAKCSKHIEIRYNDVFALAEALHKLNVNNFQIVQNEFVRIFDQINLTDLLIGLRRENIEVDHLKTADIDVENYYLSLIGKGGNR